MHTLNRTLRLPALLFYGVGVIIGAGVYSIIGAAAGAAGKAVWVSILVASVPAVLAGLCYAEMSSRVPQAGGAYAYARLAWSRRRLPAFLIGFAAALTTAATAGTVSAAFGAYVEDISGLPVWISALLLLCACTAVNIAGIRESAWVTAACTVIEVIGLVVIVWAGATRDGFARGLLDVDVGAVFAGAALVFFVFTGFEGLANLAGEAKRPGRNIPIAILVSLAVTTLLYVAVAIAAVALLEPRDLASGDDALARAAAASDPRLGMAVRWIALFSTANTALISLVVGSRLVYAMAEGGDLPRALGRTSPKRRTPWVAAIALGAAAALLLPLGSVGLMGSVTSLLTLLVFGGVAASLIVVRRRAAAHAGERAPAAARGAPGPPFRVPGKIGGVPVIAILTLASLAVLASRFAAAAYPVAGGVMIAGLVVFMVMSARTRAAAVGRGEQRAVQGANT